VFFHAHPDDEALYTGGSMARLADEGHRVVLVTATAGEAGAASAEVTRFDSLAVVRSRELVTSAKILGAERIVGLGYADSGAPGGPQAPGEVFARCSPSEVADRLARLLREEAADALTIYDPAGGYGHADHVQVHRVGTLAAERAKTPITLEATVDRKALQRALRAISWSTRRSPAFRANSFDDLYTSSEQITHRVDVSRYLPQKRAALEAHRSQSTGEESMRTVAWLLRLPPPLFRLALGREWFVEHHRSPAKRPLDDLLHTLR
jgi:LmbE family N-acetylglucosaminyl deacetylase